MNTLADYEKARLALDEAFRQHDAVSLRQKEEREKAQSVLNRLDKELVPYKEVLQEKANEFDHLKLFLIGPWVIKKDPRGVSGMLYVSNRDREWYNSRVWLRKVHREERSPIRQWEVNVTPQYREAPVRQVVLGPPDLSKTDEEDFDCRRLEVEDLLKKDGWIVLEKELSEEGDGKA